MGEKKAKAGGRSVERNNNMKNILDSAFANEALVSVSEVASCILAFSEMLPDLDIYTKLVEYAGEDEASNFAISLVVSLIGTLDLNFKQEGKNSA